MARHNMQVGAKPTGQGPMKNVGRQVAVLVSVLAATAAATGAPASKAVVGQAAPDFQVTTLDGTKLTLADFKNQVLVLNFWATWCVPCKTELPLLDRYYRLQQPAGLRVLAVTTEDSAPLS